MKAVHFRKERFDVYIGRPSKWGNPFKSSELGKEADVLSMYYNYLKNSEGLMRDLQELRGKTLGCWCAPPGGLTVDDKVVCHGQMILKVIEEVFGAEFVAHHATAQLSLF